MTERASGCSIDLVKRLAVKKATPPIFYSLKSGEILYPIDSRTLEIGDRIRGLSYSMGVKYFTSSYSPFMAKNNP